MRIWFTLTARSPRYGDVPLGTYGTLKDAEAYASTLLRGIQYLIVEHQYDNGIFRTAEKEGVA